MCLKAQASCIVVVGSPQTHANLNSFWAKQKKIRFPLRQFAVERKITIKMCGENLTAANEECHGTCGFGNKGHFTCAMCHFNDASVSTLCFSFLFFSPIWSLLFSPVDRFIELTKVKFIISSMTSEYFTPNWLSMKGICFEWLDFVHSIKRNWIKIRHKSQKRLSNVLNFILVFCQFFLLFFFFFFFCRSSKHLLTIDCPLFDVIFQFSIVSRQCWNRTARCQGNWKDQTAHTTIDVRTATTAKPERKKIRHLHANVCRLTEHFLNGDHGLFGIFWLSTIKNKRRKTNELPLVFCAFCHILRCEPFEYRWRRESIRV